MSALPRIAFLICVLIQMTAVPALSAEPDPYLDFARHLFEQGDYYRAVTEAERFLFLKPEDPRRHEAELLTARSRLALGEFDRARAAFAPVVVQRENPSLAAEAILDLGRCLEKIDPSGDALIYYRGLEDEPSLPEEYVSHIRNVARFRLGWLLLEAGRWEEASQAFDSVDRNHQLRPSAGALAGLAPEGAKLPYRSPAAAGIMSAVLPGAGQLYDGRPVDAGLAFGFNAAFLWGTMEAYNNESWVVFALLGLMEASWYGGNIYNAVNGAHIHNREVREEFLRDLRRKQAWQVGYSPAEKAIFLSWQTRY